MRLKDKKLKGFAFANDFAYDFVELSIFSTSFKQAFPAARTKSLFSLVHDINGMTDKGREEVKKFGYWDGVIYV